MVSPIPPRAGHRRDLRPRLAATAALALGLSLSGPARADTVPGTALASSGCTDAKRVEIRLGAQVIEVPRAMLRNATGARLTASDRRLGCPGLPADAERVEVEGLTAKGTILLSPESAPDIAQRTLAYLRGLRGSAKCAAPERLVCNITESHNGRDFPFQYIFGPDPKQTMSDGAPANARCMVTKDKPFCLVDMDDPRGFHVTMQYPSEVFRPGHVVGIATATQAKLTDIVGRRVRVAASAMPLFVTPADGTTRLSRDWVEARRCDGPIALALDGREFSFARTDLVGLTSALAGPESAAIGCPGTPLPVRQILLRPNRIPGILEISASAPPDRERMQAAFDDLQARNQCRSGPNYIACPGTDPRTGAAVTTFLGESGSRQRPVVECRTLAKSPGPACSMTAYANGLAARVIIAEPRSGSEITMTQLALGMTLAGLTGRR